jgi:hypothetical protein
LMQGTSWFESEDFTWDREVHLGLELNEMSVEGKRYVDDQLSPIVKLFQALKYAQLQYYQML